MNSDNISNNEKIKQIKSKYSLETLKSSYILKRIFNNVKKYIYLDIIKYNKKLQKRLNLNINDYKEYSYIEIELKIDEYKYGKFINISNEEKKYYHIYFDNTKEEIKRNYLNDNENVKKIKIKIDYEIKSFKDLFYYIDCISSIYFKKFSRNNIIDMSSMFFWMFIIK